MYREHSSLRIRVTSEYCELKTASPRKYNMSMRIIRNSGWVVRLVFGIALLMFFVAGPIVLPKFFSFPTDWGTLFWGSVLFVAIAVIAALAGALAAKFQADAASLRSIDGIRTSLDTSSAASADLVAKLQAAETTLRNVDNWLVLLQKAVKSLKDIMYDQGGTDALIYREDLEKIEAAVPANGEIWILTSALELEAGALKQIIRDNLRNGVRYTYLLPEERPDLQDRMRDLARSWATDCQLPPNKAQEQIRCVLVPEHFAYMTVAIYNPTADPPIVLVKFPTNEVYTEHDYPVIYRVAARPREAWSAFVKSLRQLMEGKRFCVKAQPLQIGF